MKRSNHIGITVVIVLLLYISVYTVVYANSAEPPSFTVIVSNPPEDLSLSLQLPDDSLTEATVLDTEQKAWETYYRFYYHMSPFGNDNLDGAVLIIQSSEKSFQCSLPAYTFDRYNNLLTLDMDTESLSIGQAPLRGPALVAMRVALTLLIEGIVFLLFGYRQKRSWLAFFAVNIITQVGLNTMLTGPSLGSYWEFGFILGETVVFVVELIAFSYLVKEFGKRRVVLYAIVANAASLVLGGLLITYLPV